MNIRSTSLISSLALLLAIGVPAPGATQELGERGNGNPLSMSISPGESINPSMATKSLEDSLQLPEQTADVSSMLSQPPLRWASGRLPLKVYVDSGFGVPGFRPGYSFVLKRCFDDWAAASNRLVSFTFVEDRASADICCTWKSDATELHESGAASQAEIYTSGGYINRAKIDVLVNWSVVDFSVADAKIRRVCLYSIGRVLGLLGKTGNPDDAMYAMVAEGNEVPRLSDRDKRALKLLYAQTPVASTLSNSSVGQ